MFSGLVEEWRGCTEELLLWVPLGPVCSAVESLVGILYTGLYSPFGTGAFLGGTKIAQLSGSVHLLAGRHLLA